MAMMMTGEVALPADGARVWAMPDVPVFLKACIPGRQSLDKTSDMSVAASARRKIIPVGAAFGGKVELCQVAPAQGYRIAGEGESGVAEFAKGGVRVALSNADGGGTLFKYDVEADVGGKIARSGSRLIGGVARSVADKVFASFAAAANAAPAQS